MAAIQQDVRWGVLRKPKRMQPESDQTLMSRQTLGGDSGVGFTTESHDKNMTERLLLYAFIGCRIRPLLRMHALYAALEAEGKDCCSLMLV